MPDPDLKISDAVNAAIKHIAIGSISSGKIRSFLSDKGYPYDVIEDAVIELTERKYIDDERAGRKVLLSRVGKKQESRSMLMMRLIDSGVERSVASDLVSDLDDNELCLSLMRASYPVMPAGGDPDSVCEGMMKLGARRGFTYENVRSAFNILIKEW